MKNVTETIFDMGEILYAKRLEKMNFILGPVEKIKPLEGIIERDGEYLIIHSNGWERTYSRGFVVILEVFTNGKWELKAIPASDIRRRLIRPVSKEKFLNSKELEKLQPIFDCSNEEKIYGYVTPEETKKVIIITEEMNVPNIQPGDIFIIKDEEDQTGSFMDRLEFEEIHVFLPY